MLPRPLAPFNIFLALRARMIRLQAEETMACGPPAAERLPRQLSVWCAPLVPVALAMTVGISADRFWVVALPASLGVALVCILAWLIFANTSRQWLALFYLWGGVAGLAAGYHHWHRYHIDANDIRHGASYDGIPTRLRGTLTTAPITQAGQGDPLRSIPTRDLTRILHIPRFRFIVHNT
jgi:hypothetical protein